ncbi:MAG: putative lipid II flippase FtsW [Pseudomonadales bacterium]
MIGVFAHSSMDRTMAAAALALALFGAIMVPSASVALGDGIWLRHWIYLAIAGTGFAALLLIPTTIWLQLRFYALAVAFALCLAVLVPGIGREVNGARRWIDLGFFTLQSSEFTKVLVLIYLAGFLQRFEHLGSEMGRPLLVPLVLLVALCALLLAEPDFGTVVVLTLLTCGLLFLAGVRLRLFLLIGAVAGLLFAVLVLKTPYRLKRFASFTDPWSVAFGDGYQLTQSLIAFGRGGFAGQGLGEGVQKLGYLPEAHNDFIFAVVVEELGLLGALLLMLVFAILIVRIFAIARRAAQQEHWHGAYLAYGAGLLLGGQFLINIGVNTGVLPTKGLTLPLISFGGNSLIASGLLLGLAFRVQLECDQPTRQVRSKSRRSRVRQPKATGKAAAGKRTPSKSRSKASKAADE